MPGSPRPDHLVTLLTGLKFAGLIIGSALAISGALRDDEGKRGVASSADAGRQAQQRRWRRFSLTLMVISFLVALISQVAEEITNRREAERSRRDAEEQLARATSTLDGVERLQVRINDVGLTASFAFPTSSPAFADDLDWLATIPSNAPARSRAPIPNFEGVISAFNLATQSAAVLDAVTVLPESRFHPFYQGKTALKELLHRLSLEIVIYKSKDGSRISTQRPPWEETKEHQELRSWASHMVPACSELTLEKHGVGRERLTAPVLKPPEFTDGRITSLRDLPNCQVTIALYADPSILTLPESTTEAVHQGLQDARVSDIWLEIDGLRFELNRFPHRVIGSGLGEGISVFELPATFDDLMHAAR